MTHITWSIERGGCCPYCGRTSVLVVAPDVWRMADGDDEITLDDEITAHVCIQCRRLVSLSLNTAD